MGGVKLGKENKYVFKASEAGVDDGKSLKFHVDGAGPYLEMLSKATVSDTEMYMSLWEITEMPRGNPPCKIHTHDVEQFVLYIGKSGTFEILNNIVPDGVELDNEWMAPAEHQYTLTETGGFYIPAGIRHNNYFVKIEEFPIYEICIMKQSGYDE